MNGQKPVSLSLNVRGMGQSATLAINERCRALRVEGRSVYNMGLGQAPFPVPVDVVEALKNAATEKDYLPVKGLPALREAVAEFHRRADHVEAQADGVIIGPGSKELMFLVQLAFYGEISWRPAPASPNSGPYRPAGGIPAIVGQAFSLRYARQFCHRRAKRSLFRIPP
jgi:aspartate aminotransferase